MGLVEILRLFSVIDRLRGFEASGTGWYIVFGERREVFRFSFSLALCRVQVQTERLEDDTTRLLGRGRGGDDLAHEIVEDLVNVGAVLSGRLVEVLLRVQTEVLCQCASSFLSNDTFVLQIALVADQNHGYGLRLVSVLHLDDVIADGTQVVECAVGDNTIHKGKALTILHVQITHGSELLLRDERETSHKALVSFYPSQTL